MDAQEILRQKHALWQLRCQQKSHLIEPGSVQCPACGSALDRRVVEHPRKQLNFDGQLIVLCKRCGASRIFMGTRDDAALVGEAAYAPKPVSPSIKVVMSPDGKLKEVRRG